MIAQLNDHGKEAPIDSLEGLQKATQNHLTTLALKKGTFTLDIFNVSSKLIRSAYFRSDVHQPTKENSGYCLIFKQLSKEGTAYHDIWERVKMNGIEKSLFKSTDEIALKVLHSNFAFFHDALPLKIARANFSWDKFHLSSNGFYPSTYGIATVKGSPLQTAFNKKCDFFLLLLNISYVGEDSNGSNN